MSTQPGPPDPAPLDPRVIRDGRWIAVIVWAGLLLTMLITSAVAISAFTDGTVASRYLNISVGEHVPPEDDAIALAGLMLSGATAVLLLVAWIGFLRLTRTLVVAYSVGLEVEDSAGPALLDAFATARAAPGDEAEEALARPLRTIPTSDVLIYVGLAWAIMIVTPAVLTAVALLS